MAETFNQYWAEQNTKRIEDQKKLFAYYFGIKDEVEEYLTTALNVTYNSDDIDELQKNYINITKKIVNQLAVVYREQAKRTIIKGTEPQDKLTEYYNNILYAVNTSDKTSLRYAKLCNTSLYRVAFENGKIKYKVLPSWYYDVKWDDQDKNKILEVSYECYFGQDKYRVYWTDEEHYRCPMLEIKQYNIAGDKEIVPGMTDTKNPYGRIPYGKLTLEDMNDFWGEGMTDLVNGNEQINVILCELVNEHIIMGGAGTVLAVNLGLEEKQEENEGGGSARKVRVGRKHPINVNNVKTDDADPRLEYVNTNGQILELKEYIDWQIKMFAMSKGLNPNSFLAEVQDTSGFSKLMDALEQMDLRRDDIEPCRIFEDERFEITKAVNNYHCSTTDKTTYKLQVIPDDCSLKVDFAEVVIYKTDKEQREEDDDNIKKNLISIIDVAKRMNPDLSDTELEGEIELNKEINDRILARNEKAVIDDEIELDEEGKPKNGKGAGNHYSQGDNHSCGECVIRSILSMYGKELKGTIDTNNGTSEAMLINILKDNGIEAKVNSTDVSTIPPKSIAYYPEQEHWVAVEKISRNKVLVNDSLDTAPQWLNRKEFEQKAQKNYFITTKKIS